MEPLCHEASLLIDSLGLQDCLKLVALPKSQPFPCTPHVAHSLQPADQQPARSSTCEAEIKADKGTDPSETHGDRHGLSSSCISFLIPAHSTSA